MFVHVVVQTSHPSHICCRHHTNVFFVITFTSTFTFPHNLTFMLHQVHKARHVYAFNSYSLHVHVCFEVQYMYTCLLFHHLCTCILVHILARDREAIELSKFSFVRTQCEERPQAIEIYSLSVPRAVCEGLAQHAQQSCIIISSIMYMYM